MSDIKEINFIKQVERTAKRDAYATAIRYIEQFGLDFGLKTIKLKKESHSQYLNSLPLWYDYATQSLKVREKSIDPDKFDEALNSLMATTKENLTTSSESGVK